MKIKIKVLNVADADAIIVSLSDINKGNLLILIDGGRTSHTSLVIEHVSKEATCLGKLAPDYILCTHFDSDHIGGILGVVNHFKDKIGHILLHKTTEIFNSIINSALSDVGSIFPSEDDTVLSFENQVILEGLRQETELIDLIKAFNIPSSEPIAKLFSFNNWDDCIEILGPSLDFYKSLFPSHFDIKDIACTESVDELDFDDDSALKKGENPFDVFDKLNRSRVTPTNLNSVILKIKYKEKLFLFTGDASIESFLSINNYEKELADIFWLKVPHHGSKNNLDSMLINLFRPTYAVISGDKHINKTMLSCFNQIGSKVELTKGSKMLSYKFDLSQLD